MVMTSDETRIQILANRPLSRTAETKDFARPTSHPVRGWTGKNKAFCSPGTQNGRRVIKVYWPMSHAKRVTRDNRKNLEYHVVVAITADRHKPFTGSVFVCGPLHHHVLLCSNS